MYCSWKNLWVLYIKSREKKWKEKKKERNHLGPGPSSWQRYNQLEKLWSLKVPERFLPKRGSEALAPCQFLPPGRGFWSVSAPKARRHFPSLHHLIPDISSHSQKVLCLMKSSRCKSNFWVYYGENTLVQKGFFKKIIYFYYPKATRTASGRFNRK